MTKTIPTKTVPANSNEKNVNCKMENLYVSLAFSLITIALLIADSIYCCFIKHRTKGKHLLPYYDTSNKLE